jgi:hypothetical protein
MNEEFDAVIRPHAPSPLPGRPNKDEREIGPIRIDPIVNIHIWFDPVAIYIAGIRLPHLRVMGRNIRFLKSDLEPFRATFKQEVGIAKTE